MFYYRPYYTQYETEEKFIAIKRNKIFGIFILP
jgi:hypothetical protein